eukprot:TRINITY_DN2420_c0_g2_i4.p1 TRINITY_DN2420_c0_g2~~TRINITY_DN2420_c0_g2_i4.p1  ORF type:complete len:581 (-),score=165.72 TRINITY_DN2420_c0_g2_i4:667-2409(-)
MMNSGIDFSSIVKSQTAKLEDARNPPPSKETTEVIDEKKLTQDPKLAPFSPSFLQARKSQSKEKQEEEPEAKLVVEESKEKGSIGLTVYLNYIRAGRNSTLVFTLAILCALGNHGAGITSNLFLTKWSSLGRRDDVEASENSEEARHYMYLYAAAVFIQCFFIFTGERLLADAVMLCSFSLHDKMLQCMLRAKMAFFDSTPAGRILNRFSRDIKTLDFQMYPVISDLVTCSFSISFTLITIAVLAPALILPFIIVAGLFWYIQRLYILSSRELKRIEAVAMSPVLHCFSQCMNGTSIIRAFGMENYFIDEQFMKEMDFAAKTLYWQVAVNRWLAARLEFIVGAIVLSTATWANSSSSMWAGLTLSYALSSTRGLTWAVRMFTQLELQMNSSERVLEYMRVPEEGSLQEEVDADLPSDWPENCDIEFDSLWLRYLKGKEVLPLGLKEFEEDRRRVREKEGILPNKRYVLKGISCSVQSGEKIGIAGRTGAGKSSFVSALFRLNEASSGCIRVGGFDLSQLGLEKLRNGLSIIPQEPLLFKETIRWNLDPFGKHADYELWGALERAHLKGIVSNLTGERKLE